MSDPAAATPIRVVLVDDEELFRRALVVLLSAEADLEVVGEAADGVEALDQIRRTPCDVVLMDVRMPRIDGIEATRRIVALPDPPAVVVLTTFENDDHVYEALLAGARGFLLKRAPVEDMLAAVRIVTTPDALLFPVRLRELVERQAGGRRRAWPRLERLTSRERDVLRAMARGRSNTQIAQELVVGVETVKSHVRSILRKLEVRDRTQAVVVAFESGFADRRPPT